MNHTRSIAVLPFKNISTDQDNEFFCDGMTEEIINALAKIPELRVISRTSSFVFKDRQVSVREIGEQLGVPIILEGSVRVGGNLLRITAQLISVEEDAHFWSQTWDRHMEHLFDIQDEISLLIADRLREQVGHLELSDRLIEHQTTHVRAYEHYLKGRYHFNQWNPETIHLAIQEFNHAIEIDPKIVDGHVGLADAYSFLAVAGYAPREDAWAKAIQAMDLAEKIDPNHAGLNHMRANQAFFTDADYASAMTYALNALTHSPTHSDSQRFVSYLYALSGEMSKAREHMFYAQSIDPLNPETRFFEAYLHYRSRDHARAASILDELLEQNEKNVPALVVWMYIHIKTHQLDKARARLTTIPDALLAPDERLGLRCLIEVSEENEDSPHLAELVERANSPTAHHAHSYLFMAYAILGKSEEAYTVLEHLFVHHSSILLLGFSDPLAAKLRETSPYRGVHQRVYPQVQQAPQPLPKKPKPQLPNEETIRAQVTKLHEFMASERPFLNPALTLRLLADQLAFHPNHLSWLINERVGKHFNEFVNQHRIEHFKQLVVDPVNSHISLLGLAYESGFNSKTVFNTAFKKIVGMTPKAYQKSQLT